MNKVEIEHSNLLIALKNEVKNIQSGKSNLFKINQTRGFSWLTDMVNFLESALSDYNKSENAQILEDSINSCSAELRRGGICHGDKVLFETIKPSMSSFAHGDWECHDKI